VAKTTVHSPHDARHIATLIASPEIVDLIAELADHALDRASRLPHSGDGRHGAGEVALRPADVDAHRGPRH
jgi:hypothetical protein